MYANVYAVSLWLTAVFCGLLAAYVWRRRPARCAELVAAILACAALWAAAYGGELAVRDLDAMRFWTTVQYPGIAAMPVFWLLFCLEYTGLLQHVRRRYVVLLFVVPALIVLAVGTNTMHGLYYAAEAVDYMGGVALHVLVGGPLYWVFWVYSYILIALGVAVLIRMLAHAPPVFGAQIRVLLVAVGIPAVVDLLRGFGWQPIGALDPTPYGFAITGALVTWSLFRNRFLELGPIARDTVIENLQDGVLVVDAEDRVVDGNPAVVRILGWDAIPAGRPLREVCIEWPGREGRSSGADRKPDDVAIVRGGVCRDFEVACSPLVDRHGVELGHSLLWRDVTALRHAQAEMHRRDRLLEASAAAARALLTTDDFHVAAQRAVAVLGEGAAVDRAYVFEVLPEAPPGDPRMSQRYEWTRNGISAEINNPELQNLPFMPRYRRWYELLSEGRPVRGCVRDFPESERELLEQQSILSLLVVPIQVDGRFWGFLGFDSCLVERDWSDSETAVLSAAAIALGGAVASNRRASELRASEERFRRYFNLPIVGVAITTPDNELIAANDRLCAILGYSRDEMVGRQWPELAPSAPTESADHDGPGSAPANVERLERGIVHRDGHEIFIEVASQLVLNDSGAPAYVIAVVQDITQRREAEDGLRKANETLDQRVRDRTLDLENANRELEVFAHSVSHDLRAPIRAAEGFSKILDEDYGPRLDDDGRRYLGLVREAAVTMSGLLDDLLRISRLNRAPMEPTRVSLSGLVQEIADLLRERAPDRVVRFEIQPDVEAVADIALIRTALDQLLGNAWKFTSHKAEATISFGVQQTDLGAAYYVRDDGAGYDPEYAEKLFGVFQRLHSAEDFEGSGVGLAMVQRIVHRHGGRVWATGAVDQGATFYFTLPERPV